LAAKERDYAAANDMVRELEDRVSQAHEDITNSKSKVEELVNMIEAAIPEEFGEMNLLQQLEIFQKELKMVIVPEDDDDVENEGIPGPPRLINITFPSRFKKVINN
jgi:hypothetical protein